MNWRKVLNLRVSLDEPLSKHTAFCIGPKARVWAEPRDRGELKKLIKRFGKRQPGYLVIGAGSKLLIRGKTIPLAIHLALGEFNDISIRGREVVAGSGVLLGRLIAELAKRGLGGFEFLSGIPASLGGAVMMNAGVSWPKRKEIGSFIVSVDVMDKNGRVMTLKKKDLKFSYRSSNLGGYFILSARLRLAKKPPSKIREDTNIFLKYRRITQGAGLRSAGCVFKNPPGESAGRLIEQCGLKGKSLNAAFVSYAHANFIINKGGARAADVLGLMRLMRQKVKKRFGITLEPEIIVV